MRTVKVVLALALTVILTTGAVAQETQKKGKRAPLHPFSSAMMKFDVAHQALTKVELNDKQKEQLNKLHESTNPKLGDVLKKVTEIVGEEKMKAAGEAAKEAKEAGKNPRQVVLAMEKACPLSDEQSEKLTALAKDVNKLHREMMKEVNSMLTDDQKEVLKKAMTPARGGKKKKADK